MDGVRGYWDRQKLLSRHGKKIHCPPWFIEQLPKEYDLDGELWMGRHHTHTDVMKVLNSQNDDWIQIRYCLFDIPSSIDTTYEERMKEMEALKPFLPPHVHVVQNIQCKGNDHPDACLSSIVTTNAEGFILREPQTTYQVGFTSSILKVKASVL